MIAACVERVTGTMHERLDSMGAENSLKQQPQPRNREELRQTSRSPTFSGTFASRRRGERWVLASYRNAVLFSLI
jgi:hypothetical protein